MTFEEFATSRLPGLVRYAVVLTGDSHLAQDVVQEVLARTQLNWRRINRADSPDAYVRRMVVNEYLSWRRSWVTRQVHAAGDALADYAANGSAGRDYAQDLADADAMWERLAKLPRKQRAVLVLRYYEQLDDATIAEIMGCAPVTVRSNASKALKTLRLDSEQQTRMPTKELR